MQKVIVLSFLLFVGCGYNPAGTPPVVYPDTFDGLVEMLDTPGKVAYWADQFTVYGDPYTGFDVPDGKDLAWSLAHDFWMHYYKGFGHGKCGSYAALMVACVREHGYETGIITYYWWNKDGTGIIGHAEAWVRETNGEYSTVSNEEYLKYRFKSLKELKEIYIKQHVRETGYLTFYDEYWENGEVHTWKQP